jgi:hypothetical protein
MADVNGLRLIERKALWLNTLASGAKGRPFESARAYHTFNEIEAADLSFEVVKR